MTEDIQKHIRYNREVREKEEFIQLIDANRVCKAKDTLSWTDVERLTEEAGRLGRIVGECKGRNEKIEQRIVKKKEHFL